MKKLLLSLTILSTLFVGCSTDDDETTIQPVEGELTGSITTNRTIAFGNYTLNGIVTIENGVTVTFDAGSKITANAANGVDAIVVKNGGKLIMNGTATQPIVLTEPSATPGSWGGIIIYGDAPINGAASGRIKIANDNSAIINAPV